MYNFNVNRYTLYIANDTYKQICIMHKLLFCIIYRNSRLKRSHVLLYASAPKSIFDLILLQSHKLREYDYELAQ